MRLHEEQLEWMAEIFWTEYKPACHEDLSFSINIRADKPQGP